MPIHVLPLTLLRWRARCYLWLASAGKRYKLRRRVEPLQRSQSPESTTHLPPRPQSSLHPLAFLSAPGLIFSTRPSHCHLVARPTPLAPSHRAPDRHDDPPSCALRDNKIHHALQQTHPHPRCIRISRSVRRDRDRGDHAPTPVHKHRHDKRAGRRRHAAPDAHRSGLDGSTPAEWRRVSLCAAVEQVVMGSG
ncbi:hypothetical protein L227DRAFT_243797 [Lentinus tigrinus ALCF2SS1-6]|uniref:Uncharacterized protein n=1 Tax=Lentinus tigrinus ALCF2SS1-6 TaxID=1328759 RepID=A0A5C2S1P1_9APHY|nr:hypothetical protein L227DRAFT_243797 [Lentinus tigrinus ALCF2SS1-6]